MDRSQIFNLIDDTVKSIISCAAGGTLIGSVFGGPIIGAIIGGFVGLIL